MGETKAYNWKKALLWGLVSLALSGLGIVLVLRTTSSEDVVGGVLAVGLRTLAVACGLVAASWIADGCRMAVLARGMGGRVPLSSALRISMMGAFMAAVTPFDTGGEPLKVYFLHKSGMSVGQSTATVTMAAMFHSTARFLLWALIPVTALFTGFSWQPTAVGRVTLAVGLGFYLFYMVLFIVATVKPASLVSVVNRICRIRLLQRILTPERMGRVSEKVKAVADDFREGVIRIRSDGSAAFMALLLSIIYWLLMTAVPVYILRGMGSSLSVLQILYISMTVYLVMAYTPTPGASGGAEVGSVVFFSPFLPAKVLATFVIVWRVATYYLTLLIGGAFVAVETLLWSMRKADLRSSG
jgi:uncharacterized protein (TIRG00374 family)